MNTLPKSYQNKTFQKKKKKTFSGYRCLNTMTFRSEFTQIKRLFQAFSKGILSAGIGNTNLRKEFIIYMYW
jgi:hypothetical protein